MLLPTFVFTSDKLMSMITIDPKTIATAKLQGYLQGSVGPRPIAFASTMDAQGNPNLSPFSFFNVFSANPPILIFSPARRVRDNSIKHTLVNAEATAEVVINVVNYDMVQLHINETVLDENGAIDQYKIDLVSRLGGNWYSRSNEGLFEVPKPLTTLGIGVDAIPNFVKHSVVFNGNDLGMLGNVESLPTHEEITIFVKENFEVKGVLSADDEEKKHLLAKEYLNKNEVLTAWKVLLAKK